MTRLVLASLVAIVLGVLLLRAFADGISSPVVTKGGGAIGLDQGINNLAAGGTSGGGSACLAGQLDFSLATGCNLVWMGH